jgi:5-methylcytosine-specific restriction endonuclease McrA
VIHRKLPLPDHFHNPIAGICRWCNEPVTKMLKNGKTSKATWHSHCVALYKFYHWPSYTRKTVWRRDKGKCAECGCQCKRKGLEGWDMDHIVPLYLAAGNKDYWELSNLQTLCKPCHKLKSAREAGMRSASRRAK